MRRRSSTRKEQGAVQRGLTVLGAVGAGIEGLPLKAPDEFISAVEAAPKEVNVAVGALDDQVARLRACKKNRIMVLDLASMHPRKGASRARRARTLAPRGDQHF